MQRSRLLILVGLLLLLGTGAIFLVLMVLGGSIGGTPTPPPPTPIPENVAQIVIAVQPLTRGVKVPPEAVSLAPWPANNLPPSAITDTKLVVGKVPRYNIDRGLPILNSMIVEANKIDFAGSEIALKIDQGKVGISLPTNRLSSVAYALTDGDHVNVLVALLFVDLNEASQTALPSKVKALLQDPVSKAITVAEVGNEGKVSNEGFGFPTITQPSESQRPRLVVQQVVQDAVVLKMGTFAKAEGFAQPTPSPVPGPTPTGAPPPTPIPPPDIITLSVSQQDALVLNYFMYSGAKFTLALRAAGDASKVDTESVTLQYTMQRFRISVPTQLAYGLEPSIRKLKTPTLPNDPAPLFIPLPDGTFICSGINCP